MALMSKYHVKATISLSFMETALFQYYIILAVQAPPPLPPILAASIIITPCACTRGKAIGLYVCYRRRRCYCHCPHENRLSG